MKETFDKIIGWIKDNILLAAGIAVGVLLLFFPKLLKFGAARRSRRRSGRIIRLPRRSNRRRNYNRTVKGKKPWQVKGSLAARRRMALIRRKRRA